MVGFGDLVGVDIAPVSKKMAVKSITEQNEVSMLLTVTPWQHTQPKMKNVW